MENKKEFRRGEVYLAYLPEEEDSNIQGGLRPIVILSNDKNNMYSSIIQYVPITSKIKRADLPVHVILETNFLIKPSMALCEQIQMKPTKTVEDYIDWRKGCIGRLSYSDMCKISYGVAVQLGYAFMINTNACNKPQYAIA
jgi:mRNA interferase MazF